ncbi:hypothetical protein Y032_0569g83 [Ancylostoma ceylanicum]|uniref:Uncharacterized protein n=1 Tax=Ancylostoma ceylanicum TaxID=53326 RepID=A0A016WQ97_9BILA|nr:hypothetical protein Y032_0569g83 [Ancylostoma ceylanicum]
MSGLSRTLLTARSSLPRAIQRSSSGGFYGSHNFDSFKSSMTGSLKQSHSERFYSVEVHFVLICAVLTQHPKNKLSKRI